MRLLNLAGLGGKTTPLIYSGLLNWLPLSGRLFLRGTDWEWLGSQSVLSPGKACLFRVPSRHFLSLGYTSSWLSQHVEVPNTRLFLVNLHYWPQTGRISIDRSVYFHLCLQTAVSMLNFSLFQDLAKCGEKTIPTNICTFSNHFLHN